MEATNVIFYVDKVPPCGLSASFSTAICSWFVTVRSPQLLLERQLKVLWMCVERE